MNVVKAICVASLPVVLVATATCRAQEHSGWFTAAHIGVSRMDAYSNEFSENKSHSALAAYGGYRWAISPHVSLGLEGGLARFRDSAVLECATPEACSDTDFEYGATLQGATLGVNARFSSSTGFAVHLRAGAFYWNADGWQGFATDEVPTGALFFSFDTSGTNWYSGVSVAYDLTKHLSLNVGYDRFMASKKYLLGSDLQMNTGVVSLGMEYRWH